MNTYWFRQHRYGYGATPKTWEGWVLTASYGLLVGGLSLALKPERQHFTLFVTSVVVATLLFVLIAWRKTEGGWRWRWGEGDD